MKRIILTLALVSMLPFAGCKTASTTQPLAPGYHNAADQQMGSILSAARNFYNSIKSQSEAGTLTLTPAVKTAFNDFSISLNAADSVYLAYHGGTATQAQAQAAVNQVQSKQAALPLPGAKQ